MLAYSSIAHAGFILTGFLGIRSLNEVTPGSLTGVSAVLFYLTTYGFTTLAAFALVTVVRDGGGEATHLSRWQGLGRESPLVAGLFAFLLFPMVDSRSVALLTLAIVLGQGVLHPAWYGPLAALYTELFSTGSRYTGASLGYQIAGLGGGIAPLVFASILAGGGSTTTVSIIIAAGSVLCVACVAALRETASADLTADPEAVDAEPVRR